MEKQSKEIRPLGIYGVYRKQFDKIMPPFVMSFNDKDSIDYFKKEFDFIYDDLENRVKEKDIPDIESARAGFIDSVQDTCVIKIAEWNIEKQEFINIKNILCDFKDYKKEVEVVDEQVQNNVE